MENIYAALINWIVAKKLDKQTIINILQAANYSVVEQDIDKMIVEFSKIDIDKYIDKTKQNKISTVEDLKECIKEEPKEEDMGIFALFKES